MNFLYVIKIKNILIINLLFAQLYYILRCHRLIFVKEKINLLKTSPAISKNKKGL